MSNLQAQRGSGTRTGQARRDLGEATTPDCNSALQVAQGRQASGIPPSAATQQLDRPQLYLFRY